MSSIAFRAKCYGLVVWWRGRELHTPRSAYEADMPLRAPPRSCYWTYRLPQSAGAENPPYGNRLYHLRGAPLDVVQTAPSGGTLWWLLMDISYQDLSAYRTRTWTSGCHGRRANYAIGCITLGGLLSGGTEKNQCLLGGPFVAVVIGHTALTRRSTVELQAHKVSLSGHLVGSVGVEPTTSWVSAAVSPLGSP